METHRRTTSNSFRLTMNRSSSPSRPSSSSSTPLGYNRRAPSTSSNSRKRPSGPLLRESVKETVGDVVGWLGGRVGSGGRGGPRRWTVLIGVVVLLVVYQSMNGGGGAADGGGVEVVGGGGDSWWKRATAGKQQVPGGDGGGEIPAVDRAALEKLRLLEIHYGADEDAAQGEDEPRSRPITRYAQADTIEDAPPLVKEIPDVVKPNPSAPVPLSKVPAEVLDAEVCPEREGEPCAFLVPAWLGEQETKAQVHLYQLGLLAMALNRTLVLPNVSKSRLGTCYSQPFDFYYSPNSLSDLGISTISQADFVAWSDRRDPPASAQVVSMVGAKSTYSLGAIEIDSASDPNLIPSKPTRNLCLRAPRTRLDFSGHSPLAIYPPANYHKTEAGRLGFGESVVNTLRSEEVGSKSSRASALASADYSLPNVLAFNYELRFPMMSPIVVNSFVPSLPTPLPFTHFPYAETWSDVAHSIATTLSPMIAIHWRTETLSPKNLAPCASSLIRKLVTLKQRYPEIENVYLATDYPLEELEAGTTTTSSGGLAHSGTFAKSVTDQHHVAFRNFLRDFKTQARGLKLTTFAKEQSHLLLPPHLIEMLAPINEGDSPASLSDLDPGLYGIIDKSIAMQAEVFLTGVPGIGSSTVGACSKLSSFTNQLIEERERRWNEQGREGGGGMAEGEERELVRGRLWNTVSHWALKGETDD